jgi:hypothetical protein
MKKILSLITLIVILSSSFVSFAGEKGGDTIPAYRNAGYRGNVNIDNHILVWFGIETSHGYMINTQNYIGAGAEFFMSPFADDLPMFGNLFGEYQLYFQKDGSTPTAGIRAGYCLALKDLSGNTFDKAVTLEPRIGWEWAKSDKFGLNLNLGFPLYFYKNYSDSPVQTVFMPMLSFGFIF